jgi:hypothetical protein
LIDSACPLGANDDAIYLPGFPIPRSLIDAIPSSVRPNLEQSTPSFHIISM